MSLEILPATSEGRDPQFWHDLAAETRAMARKLSDPESIRALLVVPDEYERLAELAKPTTLWIKKEEAES